MGSRDQIMVSSEESKKSLALTYYIRETPLRGQLCVCVWGISRRILGNPRKDKVAHATV